MFQDLAAQLGIDLESPEQQRADNLVREHKQLLQSLVAIRKARGLTQDEVARALGIRQPSVAAFERPDSDPKLSTIRRYAHAVGASIGHSVRQDAGDAVRATTGPATAPDVVKQGPPEPALVALVHSVVSDSGEVEDVYSFALNAQSGRAVDFPRLLTSMPTLRGTATATIELADDEDESILSWGTSAVAHA